MNKSTPFKTENSYNKTDKTLCKEPKALPTEPRTSTINNIISFSKSYSVRKGRMMGKMEFLLN